MAMFRLEALFGSESLQQAVADAAMEQQAAMEKPLADGCLDIKQYPLDAGNVDATDLSDNSLAFQPEKLSPENSAHMVKPGEIAVQLQTRSASINQSTTAASTISTQATAEKCLNFSAGDPYNRELGQITPAGTEFCPIIAVSKFPYKYMRNNSQESQEVSVGFFAADQFYNRSWTLLYIYPPPEVSDKPIILVPASEVKAFLSLINTRLPHQLSFPNSPGFKIKFDDDGTPRPRFLGISLNRDAYRAMEQNVPASGAVPKAESKGSHALARPGDDKSWEAFKKKMEDAIAATKNKNKASKEKKAVLRVQQKTGWCSQLCRTQRYLGLRERVPRGVKSTRNGEGDSDWEENLAIELGNVSIDAKDIDLKKPAKFLFDSNVVFICIDVEAFERAQSMITEVDISVLDTEDIKTTAPGEAGKNWSEKIQSRHFRIREHSHLVNKDFIVGCPDRFEFGQSEYISKLEAPGVIASFFKPPFGKTPDENAAPLLILDPPEASTKRNVILVGHDTISDINYLRQMGFDVVKCSSLLEVLDTADLYRAFKQQDQNPTSLGNVIYELGMTGWNLHNAGNDAKYTMQAMIAIAVKALFPIKDTAASVEAMVEAAVKDAEERVRDDAAEWKQAQRTVDDGGEPDQSFLKIKPKMTDSGRGARGGQRGRGVGRGDGTSVQTRVQPSGAVQALPPPGDSSPLALADLQNRYRGAGGGRGENRGGGIRNLPQTPQGDGQPRWQFGGRGEYRGEHRWTPHGGGRGEGRGGHRGRGAGVPNAEPPL